MRGWTRGGTLKECQSDFQRVLFPPLLVTSCVGSVARALGVLEGTMTQGPVVSALADNDDA